MLLQPSLEKLRELRLFGMAKALEDQLRMSDITDLSFEDRIGLLLDRESTDRSSKPVLRILITNPHEAASLDRASAAV